MILLDLMLPGLSGEELLRRLKEFPVIIISAKTDVRDKVEMLMEGAADYMTKPFDNQEASGQNRGAAQKCPGRISQPESCVR